MHKFSGTGRYQIEYANDATVLSDGTYSIAMGSPEIIEIRDSYEAAGVPTYYRVVPSNGTQDAELFLMESTAGSTGTYVQGRSSASASSSVNGAGGDEAFVHTSPASQWEGLRAHQPGGERDVHASTGTRPGRPARW